MTRRELRETTFRLLYMHNFYDEDQNPVPLDVFFADVHPDEYTVEDELYIRGKIAKVIDNRNEIDSLIEGASKGWKVSRINLVDLCILRLAVSEMLYEDDIPYRVAINEAVELSKNYGGDDSPSFINGVLGEISKQKGL